MAMNRPSRLWLLQVLLLLGIALALFVTRGTKAANGPLHLSRDRSYHPLVLSPPGSSIQRLHLAGYALAQSPEDQAPANGYSLPSDWSDRHLIFSDPGAFSDAISHGRVDQWQHVVNDPRYLMQQVKRGDPVRQQAIAAGARIETAGLTGGPSLWQALRRPWRARNPKTPAMTFRLALQLAMVILVLSLTAPFFRQRPWTPKLMLLVSAVGCLFLSSCGGGNTSSVGTSIGPEIAADWRMLAGSGAKGVAGVSPAKFSFSVGTADCSDFVIFPSDVAGSSTVPSIVAYTNLYSGCATTLPNNPAPNVLWAANLNAGKVATSPVLSLDGTQVAFVATIGPAANLVVLNIPSSVTGVTVSQITSKSTSPGVNTSTQCTAPCADWATFSSSNADTYSSPYYDYGSNNLYVGDDKGVLHQFKNVFHSYNFGTTNTTEPSETTGGGPASGWPQTIVSNDPLSSPVYDSVSQKVFVGINAQNSGIASIPSTGGSNNIVKSVQLNKANTTHSFDLTVDSSAAKVYVFTAHAAPTSPYDTGGVAQMPVAFTASTTATWALLGTGGASALDSFVLYAGDFDNNYYTSGSNPNLYVCAAVDSTSSASTAVPTLFRISMSGTFGATVSTGPVVGTTTVGDCSGITEFHNSGTDYIFLSQQGTNITASPVICPSGTGCILSYIVTSGTLTFSSSAPVTNATSAEPSGTGGIIIDNDVGSPTGASNVYFSVLGSQSCARTVTGSTNSTTTITATAGIFTAGDVGATITGTGIPSSTTITSVTNSTTAVISHSATATNSGVSFSITDTGGCNIQASQSSFS
jgi:hypothetical protein